MEKKTKKTKKTKVTKKEMNPKERKKVAGGGLGTSWLAPPSCNSYKNKGGGAIGILSNAYCNNCLHFHPTNSEKRCEKGWL